jgi:lambda repressor-like predicted transcriptional regulator
MNPVPPFKNAIHRSGWVQTELRMIGSSFSAIALENGWSRNAVSAAMHRASDPQEKAIAQALDVRQCDLFPERYDAEGDRLHPVKDKAFQPAGNVKHRRAA